MLDPIILGALTAITLTLSSALPGEIVLAQHEMTLNDRHAVPFVNEVFKDNILLNLAYLDGRVNKKEDIHWDQVKGSARFEFRLEPGQAFAFHDDLLPKFQGKVVKTTNAHFNAQEGFKFSGYLYGDGVCHLASLIYWTAKDGGLEAEVPTNHNFMSIPGISKEYGVSIFSNPLSLGANARQNLYVTNNQDNPVTFKFIYADDKLKLSIVK